MICGLPRKQEDKMNSRDSTHVTLKAFEDALLKVWSWIAGTAGIVMLVVLCLYAWGMIPL